MKTLFVIQLFLFLLTSLITVNVFGQHLPADPGSDPIHSVDTVAQTSNMKSLNSNLKEARNDSSSKRHLPQLGKTLPIAIADNHEKKYEQLLKSHAATTLAADYR